jgi:hypothetical protein
MKPSITSLCAFKHAGKERHGPSLFTLQRGVHGAHGVLLNTGGTFGFIVLHFSGVVATSLLFLFFSGYT